ncbi:MAG: TraR/DksA C4-type zinc finger protein [Patescibacteria group bacterium]
MNEVFAEEMKSTLLAEKIKLEEELSKFAHRNVKATDVDYDAESPSFGDDEDENAQEVAAYSNNLSLENELEKALRDIEQSLKRIDEGKYGMCKYCKTEIEEARLRARPTSTSCIACKKTLTQEL